MGRFCLTLFIATFWVWFWLKLIHATFARKGNGREVSGQRGLQFSQSQNSGPTNQSEPIGCFWGSGFIKSGSQLVIQMTIDSKRNARSDHIDFNWEEWSQLELYCATGSSMVMMQSLAYFYKNSFYGAIT